MCPHTNTYVMLYICPRATICICFEGLSLRSAATPRCSIFFLLKISKVRPELTNTFVDPLAITRLCPFAIFFTLKKSGKCVLN
jgi:hypothetical protein